MIQDQWYQHFQDMGDGQEFNPVAKYSLDPES